MKIKNIFQTTKTSPVERLTQFLDSKKPDEVFTSGELEDALDYCRGGFRSSLNHSKLKPYRIYQPKQHRYLYGNKKALQKALKLFSSLE